MAKQSHVALPYLSRRGRLIFSRILKHIKDAGIDAPIDSMELSMLANSFDVFEIMAEKCNKGGYVVPVTGKNGTFDQAVPEYTIMKQQYDTILKHGPKFGLNPGDREKIFSGMKKAKKKVGVADGLD